MSGTVSKLLSGAVIAIAFFSASSKAATYSNTNDGSYGYFIGFDTVEVGEVFTAPESHLTNFSFFSAHYPDNSHGDVDFIISAWSGVDSVGVPLYSTLLPYNPGQPVSAQNISVTLQRGQQYIAYLSSRGVPSATPGVMLAGNAVTDPLGGQAYVRFFGAAPGNGIPAGWFSASPNTNLSYSMTFTSAVPEPESYVMWLAGLGFICAVRSTGRKLRR
ncbi:PEP-CTERM sorting domain-containing protein [Rugamonas rivuli]|uniref:PEP-CTERM sorting domain-containing protein n=1 Tax=Rugamonas rivuli TaxID=2743358 RepID=A0A843SNS4_9BURK|nr:PEP-CTERM sorting domain-containing protein [Rugamonas rivuli]MQA23514.1 PEP-CTERM sorting domain-containing protein [Rugamonas rivuli]